MTFFPKPSTHRKSIFTRRCYRHQWQTTLCPTSSSPGSY